MKVLFLVPNQNDLHTSPFDHQLISLAEGFLELGIPFEGNDSYRHPLHDNGILIPKAKSLSTYGKGDLIIMSCKIIQHYSSLLERIDSFRRSDVVKVLIDGNDGLITPSFKEHQKFDFVLKCHFNSKFKYPINFHPWQFGLSNRIIKYTAPPSQKAERVMCNYRVSHALRKKANHVANPIVKKYYPVDTTIDKFHQHENSESLDHQLNALTLNRHNPAYYNRLRNHFSSLCFGGFLTNKYLVNDWLPIKALRKINYDLEWIKNDRIFQWDSWRLWESWAAATTPIHLDFEMYGMKLPVQPTNGVHYIGVDFDNLYEFEEQIKDVEHVKQVGLKGQQWVLEHYSPISVAERLLRMIKIR